MTHSQEETHTHTHTHTQSHSLKGKPNKDSYTNKQRGQRKERRGDWVRGFVQTKKNQHRDKQREKLLVRKNRAHKTASWDQGVRALKWKEAEEPRGTSAGTYPLPREPLIRVGAAETDTPRLHTPWFNLLNHTSDQQHLVRRIKLCTFGWHTGKSLKPLDYSWSRVTALLHNLLPAKLKG